jgi:hypothetical protein
MRWGAAALALALPIALPPPVAADDSILIEIVEYGIYSADLTMTKQKSERGDKLAKASNICHVATTEIIPARRGMQFGFRYRVHGPDPGEKVALKQTLKIPSSPIEASEPLVDSNTIKAVAGELNYTAFAFRGGWLDRLGVWTFEIGRDKQVLAAMAFTLVEDTGHEMKPDDSSTCFLVSSREGERPWHSI